MTRFYIENEIGGRYDLSADANVKLSQVEGLGMANDITSADISNGFFVSVDKKPKQQSIVGDLLFLDDSLFWYQDFTEFLAISKKLMFVYQLDDERIYYRDIEIKSISRDPGLRSKIAVYSPNPNIDPVGSCVGQKGIRIQNIIINNGIIGGISAVLNFFPQLVVLFLCLSLLETTGYMSRLSFFLDRIFHKDPNENNQEITGNFGNFYGKLVNGEKYNGFELSIHVV